MEKPTFLKRISTKIEKCHLAIVVTVKPFAYRPSCISAPRQTAAAFLKIRRASGYLRRLHSALPSPINPTAIDLDGQTELDTRIFNCSVQLSELKS
jgi:hypothetical protein